MSENNITDGLRHLLTFGREEAIMDPVFCKSRQVIFVTMGAAALRNFIFMVREFQIATAAMNIDWQTQMLSAIAEHSMCQPGRPRPHGLSQPGCSALDGFHRTKSAGSFCKEQHRHARKRCARTHPRERPERPPYFGKDGTEKAHDLPLHRHDRVQSALAQCNHFRDGFQ